MIGSLAPDRQDELAQNLGRAQCPEGRGVRAIRFMGPRGVPNTQDQTAGALKSTLIGQIASEFGRLVHAAT